MPDSDRTPKWLHVYNRMIEEARERLDDSPWVEKVVGLADVRAESFGGLRDDLSPLRRLVISYTRGSYRQAPRSDLAEATAAIAYVAMPIDAIPDYLPGGLRDDSWVVRRTKERLAETLANYREWEESLVRRDELTTVVESRLELVRESDMELSVLERDDRIFEKGEGPTAVAHAAQQLLRSSGEVEGALRSGRMLRVVGPKHLLEGLDAKKLETVKTATGSTATVRDKASKEFVGQLRLKEAGAAQASKAAVSVGFAAASALTMQYYLHNIDTKLGAIKRGLEALGAKHLDTQVGSLDTALGRCREVQDALMTLGRVDSNDHQRLNTADDRADDVFNSLRRTLAPFVEGSASAMGSFDELDKASFEELLEDAAQKRLLEFEALIYAACVRDRVNAVRVLVSAADGGARTELSDAVMTREHDEMLAFIREVAAAFDRLCVSKRTLDARWPHLGGPERQLASLLTALDRIGGPRGRSEAEDALAPSDRGSALAPTAPIVAEYWFERGSLRGHAAEIH